MSHAKNSRLFLILLLGSLSAFGPFITDLYLPALPGMGEYFHTSASMVQLTLTTSMIGLGLGQLFIGPISDKYGRIRPLMVSLAIYIASTLLIVFTQDIEGMIVLRAIQGLSSAGSVVLSRAIAADLYQGEELSRFFALLMSVNGIAPIVSPVFGALLLQFTNWRGIFVVLVLIGVVLMAFCLRLEETHPPHKRMTGSLLSIFTVLGKILTNRTFMGFAGIQALIMGVLFAYIASSSFIFQTAYGVGKFAYGLCFGLNGAALVAGAARATFRYRWLCCCRFTGGAGVVRAGTSLVGGNRLFPATFLYGLRQSGAVRAGHVRRTTICGQCFRFSRFFRLYPRRCGLTAGRHRQYFLCGRKRYSRLRPPRCRPLLANAR